MPVPVPVATAAPNPASTRADQATDDRPTSQLKRSGNEKGGGGMNAPCHLSREPTFCQEAYLASSAYIRQIGSLLQREYGFREITEDDVALLYPFAISANEGTLLLNLMSTSPPSLNTTNKSKDHHVSSRGHTIKARHVIQLPNSLSSLLTAPSPFFHPRISTFCTLLTPTACHITHSTLSIPPLTDLISFLQCLLPSTSALALSPSSALVRETTNINARGTSGGELDGNDDEEEEGETDDDSDDEKRVMSRIEAWRQTNQPMTTTTISPIPEGEGEEAPEEGEAEPAPKEMANMPSRAPSRSHTPCPRWLEKNEDILRETVGCSYYRHLKERAEEGIVVG